MALGVVQAGYKNSLYMYAAGNNPEWDSSFEEWLAELTTGLELAMEGNKEDMVTDSEEGTECSQEDEQTEAYSARKKEWEEVLEQANMVEAMLRQMMENGLGQQKEEEKTPEKQKDEEPDNDFTLEGIPLTAEGKNHDSAKTEESGGNSQFYQTDSGHGAEYLNLFNGGKQVLIKQRHTICLTCETQCDRKKQWKITE